MAVEVVRGPRWSRAYPPLVLFAVAVIVAAFVLPSALNLPQSNPSTVLEYAPVPPEDDTPPPPNDGNLASLGLGSTGSLLEGGEPPPPPPPPDEGAGSRPTDKQCVGDPPRQTEDPMAPPCVPFFDGDNFGATYQGVTREEINVLIYTDRGCPNFECNKDAGTYENLSKPGLPACPKTWPADNPDHNECDYVWVRTARAFNRYFNSRFQTYRRKVNYWVFTTTANTAASRRSDAAANWEKLKPFAVIDFATYFGHNEAYDDAMAARGVLVFTSRSALRNEYFTKNAPRSWNFYPDVERWSEMYTSYICQKVAPFPVKRFGNPPGAGPPNGEERRFGLFYTTDPSEPGLHLFRELVMKGLRDCGVSWETEGSFPHSGFLFKTSDDGTDQSQAIASFRTADVTTVLYLGGIEGKFSHLADGQKYYPEIVIAGDLENDNNQTARGQNQNVWRNVWGTHLHLRLDRPEATPAFRAYRESYPNASPDEARFANEAYRDHFMLFQAIQVAGPRLTPQTVDQGFHAIPEHQSTSPYIASCFFEIDDYSCVKDATEVWWDTSGDSPSGTEPGCHRLVDGGTRYQAWQWPEEDTSFSDGPCTGYEARYQIDPG